MKKFKKTKKTIDGRTVRYATWRAEVVRLADERKIPDAIRDQVTEPMLEDGFTKNEFPAAFLDTVVAYFS